MTYNQQKHPGDCSPTGDRHTDKRIKLDEPAPAAHPFESVDYWLDFEPDQQEETKTDTSFDSCFSQWLESSKANDAASAPVPTTVSYDERPAAAPTAGLSTNPNDFFFFGNPSPDVDDALKLMNLGEPWEAVGDQGQPRNNLFPDLFPPTPASEDAPMSSQPYSAQSMTPGTQPASISTPYLGEEEKMSLLSLALNLGPLPASLLPSGNFDLGMASLCRDSQSPASERGASLSKSTKPSPKGVDKYSKAKGRHVDRAAHNDIERRYRTNLKHKIAELRDAIPTLCGEDDEGSGGDPTGPSSKISKGTVLTKATEYIHQLEQRNKAMEAQQQTLLRRLQAVEILLDPRRTLAARMGTVVKTEAGTPGQQRS